MKFNRVFISMLIKSSISEYFLCLCWQELFMFANAHRKIEISFKLRMMDHRLNLAISHMRNQHANPCLLENIAHHVGLSRSGFFKLFQDQLGTSPLAYWNAIRIEEALKLLSTQPDTMTVLSMDLGFSSPGNFSRFFRSHMGISPTRYRRLQHAA